MNKAVFLDRDGTINVDKNYLSTIEDFEFLPGVFDGLRAFKKAGYLLIVITNQSGIARGYFSEVEYELINNFMIQKLKEEGILLDDVLYCPHHPEAVEMAYRIDCQCRKPKLGLFYQAIEKWDICLQDSIAIGDNMRDLEICNGTNCKGFLITRMSKIKKENIPGIIFVSGIIDVANLLLSKKSCIF